IYNDKKHFILICNDICNYCFEDNQYEAVLKIDKAISVFTEELDHIKDIDQWIAITNTKIWCAQCFNEYLLEECIEPCSNDFVNFEDANRVYVDAEKDKFTEWRNKWYENWQEAVRIATLINQTWLLFNIGITLWRFFLAMLKSPNFTNIINENLLPVFAELFESLNNSMIYYESIGSEFTNTDYFQEVDVFVNWTSIYTRIWEAKSRQDECIRICDIMLSRKINSSYRKIFDTMKARASRAPVDPSGKKKAPPPKPVQNKKDQGSTFVPSQDMTLISDCFSNLENALNTVGDDKTKLDLLKKGIEMLKGYKINFNDENTLELSSELWYKYGVQFYSINTNECYKYAWLCANNCVNTYDNIDIGITNSNLNKSSQPDSNTNNTLPTKRTNIGLNLQKWYALGFLLNGDSIIKLIDPERQERLSQINLYFQAIEKIMWSAKIAEKAKQYLVIVQNLKAFYSIIINLIDQPQNREKLCKNFLILHQIWINNRPGGSIWYSDSEFWLLFFSIFCSCINEIKNWELGEKIIGEALKIIPNQFHHILLEHKLFYYSKQGKSFLQNLSSSNDGNSQGGAQGGAGGGDKDVLTKAKWFSKWARSSPNKIDQFNAYNRAIDWLKNDQNIYVCNIIFEWSSWLYKNNYPFNDIEENLNQAADILLEIESIFDDEDDLEDDGQTLHSKRSTSSRRSRLSKRSRSKKSGVSGSRRRSSITGGKSKASERSKSRNYSSHTSKTKTIFAKMLD
ncbi:MAG: hypothetical protein ACRC42_02035, partial [Mycoplasma sp.]